MYDITKGLYYRRSEAPCKGCMKRTAGCHGQCKEYADWAKEEQAISETIRKTKTTESLKLELEIKAMTRARNRRMKRR